MTVAEQMTRSSDMAVGLVLTEFDTPEVFLSDINSWPATQSHN